MQSQKAVMCLISRSSIVHASMHCQKDKTANLRLITILLSHVCNNDLASLLHATTMPLLRAPCNDDMFPIDACNVDAVLPHATTIHTPGDASKITAPHTLHHPRSFLPYHAVPLLPWRYTACVNHHSNSSILFS